MKQLEDCCDEFSSSNTYFVPKISVNLISAGALDSKGCSQVIQKDSYVVRDANGKRFLIGHRSSNNLYKGDTKRYIITFIEDYSRRSFVGFIESKEDVFEHVKRFIALAERSRGCKIKHLISDRRTEYTNQCITDFLKNKGIKFQHSTAYCPQQNGIAERINRTLLELPGQF